MGYQGANSETGRSWPVICFQFRERTMNAKFAERTFRIFLIFAFVLGTVWMPDRRAGAQEPNPWIQAFPDQDRVNANDWPLGTDVTMTVNGSYTYTSKAGQSSWDPDGTTAGFDIRSYGLKAGDAISMTGGGITRSMTVTALQITTIDVSTSTVLGTADADKQVYVWVKDAGGIWLTPAPDGSWTAEFAPFSFVPGTEGGATQPDAAGNATQVSWHTLNPVIQAFPDQDKVNANDWPIGTVVSMTINGSPPYTATVGASSWDPYGTAAEFRVENYDTQAGDEISMTGGGITRSMIVTSLTITNIDASNATVSGMADKDKVFHVWVNGGSDFYITPDSDGKWTADFKPFVFVPGTNGGAQQTDEFGNYTQIDWLVPNPSISVRANDDRVEGWEWPLGATVTVTVNDPNTPADPDITRTADVYEASWNPGEFRFDLDLHGVIDIQPGFEVTASNADTTKAHTVTSLAFTEINIDTDTITGKAVAGSQVDIWACDNTNCYNSPAVDVDGNSDWTADFTNIYDIVLGTWVDSSQRDDDGDKTMFGQHVPSYGFTFFPAWNGFVSDDWPLDVPIQFTADDPDTAESPDFQDIIYSQPAPWDPSRTWLIYEQNPAELLFAPGFTLTLDNGQIRKSLIISSIQITAVNLELDTVSGIAEPFANVHVSFEGSDAQRHVTTDEYGNWAADFSEFGEGGGGNVLYDIGTGADINAHVSDEDGDITMAEWHVPPLPTIAARPGEQQISGYDWPEGAAIALAVDNPSTPQSPDYTDSLPADMQDWGQTEAYFDLRGRFYFGIGYIITMTDGTTTKVHTVTSLDVTAVDADNDLVYGVADPGDTVHIFVWIPWPDSYAWRDVVTDANGEWVADFSIPVDGMTYDITDDTFGEVLEKDEDEDFTNIYWYWPMAAKPCATGDTVSGTVFEHDGITPVPFARIQFETFDSSEPLFFTYADSNGQYACYLPNGDYRILAWIENYTYTQEYYNEATDVNATPLHITTGIQLASINFTISPTPFIEHFTFNMNNPLLQDRAVRDAIALGTDRQRILSEAFLPNSIYGMVSISIVPPEHWASAPSSELDLYPFDPVQARVILEAAGWIDRDSDGYRENVSGVELSFVFKTSPTPFRQASAEIFRQNMQDIGIHITPEFAPLSEFLGSHDFDIAEFAWASGIDNEPYLGEYITGSQSNYAGYSNPAYDLALNNARATVGDAAKLPYLYEAQGILSHDLPIFPLFTRYNVLPVSTPTGSNITVSPDEYLDIHFDEVTQEGITTVISTNINPADLPPNFQLLGQVYDIGTNAQFANAQVCFNYDDTGLTSSQESAIRLFHLEANAWVDVTDAGYPDTSANIVCGTVTGFSPFAVMFGLNQPPVAEAGSDQIIFFGDTVTLNASASSDPEGATLTYEWDLDNDSEYDDAAGVTIVTSFNQVGMHTIGLRVTDDGGLSDTDTAIVTVLPYTMKGFYPPVDMNGIFNIVKGGSTVPLKFEIFAGSTELTDVSYIKGLFYAQTSCDTTATVDEIETIATGDTSLRYDLADGQFVYNWKTPSAAGTCYRVTMTTIDGSSLVAYFKFK
jgi:hypothetical protein